jgi:hypothetical protein
MSLARVRPFLAAAYFFSVLALQLRAFFADPFDGEGYVYVVMFLTAPWSLGILMIAEPLHAVVEGVVGRDVAFDVVNVATLLVGAGVNAVLIGGLGQFVNWIRRSPALRLTGSVVVIGLTFVALVAAYPRIEAVTAERRRPANLPKEAFAWGSWAWHWCEFRPDRNIDHCII